MAKKKWIKGATENKGALHKRLGVPEGENIPEDKLRAALKSKDPKARKEASLAMTLKGMHGKAEKPPEKKSARATMYGRED